MSLMILALAQAAAAPSAAPPSPAPPRPAPLAVVESATAGGGFALSVAALPADKLPEVQDMLDAAAAKRCGAKPVVAGDQSYDQSTTSAGLAAPMISHLRMTYTCG